MTSLQEGHKWSSLSSSQAVLSGPLLPLNNLDRTSNSHGDTNGCTRERSSILFKAIYDGDHNALWYYYFICILPYSQGLKVTWFQFPSMNCPVYEEVLSSVCLAPLVNDLRYEKRKFLHSWLILWIGQLAWHVGCEACCVEWIKESLWWFRQLFLPCSPSIACWRNFGLCYAGWFDRAG